VTKQVNTEQLLIITPECICLKARLGSQGNEFLAAVFVGVFGVNAVSRGELVTSLPDADCLLTLTDQVHLYAA